MSRLSRGWPRIEFEICLLKRGWLSWRVRVTDRAKRMTAQNQLANLPIPLKSETSVFQICLTRQELPRRRIWRILRRQIYGNGIARSGVFTAWYISMGSSSSTTPFFSFMQALSTWNVIMNTVSTFCPLLTFSRSSLWPTSHCDTTVLHESCTFSLTKTSKKHWSRVLLRPLGCIKRSYWPLRSQYTFSHWSVLHAATMEIFVSKTRLVMASGLIWRDESCQRARGTSWPSSSSL